MAARSRQAGPAGDGTDLLRSTFGEVLRSWRRRREKLSQVDLSIQAGLPSNAVGALERGERTISAEELVKLCIRLGVPVAVFLEEVKSAQVRALRGIEEELLGKAGGGRKEGRDLAVEPVPARLEKAQESDVFLVGVRVARYGGDLDDLVKVMSRILKQEPPASEPEPEETS